MIGSQEQGHEVDVNRIGSCFPPDTQPDGTRSRAQRNVLTLDKNAFPHWSTIGRFARLGPPNE